LAQIRESLTVVGGSQAAYTIPYFTTAGTVSDFERTRLLPGGAQKYRQAPNTPNHVYIPPLPVFSFSQDWSKDPQFNLVITEGEKKALAAAQAGIPCLGLGGVDNWINRTKFIPIEAVRHIEYAEKRKGVIVRLSTDRDTRDLEELVAPELLEIDWRNRQVLLCYDTPDAYTKEGVQRAAFQFALWLRNQGAHVSIFYLDPKEDRPSEKVGLDDWLLEDPSRADQLIAPPPCPFPPPPDPRNWLRKLLNQQSSRPIQEEAAVGMLAALDSRGDRYKDDRFLYYYEKGNKHLHAFDFNDKGLYRCSFGSLLNDLGLRTTDQQIVSRLANIYATEDPVADIRAHKVLARRDSAIYLQLSNGEMLRITPQDISVQENGTDGVLFVADSVIPANLDRLAVALDQVTKPHLWQDAIKSMRLHPLEPLTLEETQILLTVTFYLSPWLWRWHGMQLPLETVIAEAGAGKEQPISEPVLTPAGWRPMGDLIAGDEVIGSNGLPTKITAVFPQGVKDVYQITFTDGSSTRCGLDHLWAVTSAQRRQQKYPPRRIALRELLGQDLCDGRGGSRYFIPVVAPIVFPDANFPLDPYLLGALIGDGSFLHTQVRFTTTEPDMLELVRKVLPDGVSIDQDTPTSAGYRVGIRNRQGRPSPVKEVLKQLGLFGHRSEAKFLPVTYLFGSIQQRFALLQGLLDTDGTVLKQNGQAVFCTTSKQLVVDVEQLVWSLGGTTRRRSYRAPVRSGNPILLSITLPPELGVPFRLPRKVKAWKDCPRKKRLPTRAIASIVRAGAEESKCIQVDADDHLYVTKDYTVTSNTFLYNLRMEVLTGNPELGHAPRDMRDFMAQVAGAPAMWVCDNLGKLSTETFHQLSDEIARLITEPNPTIKTRELFTTAGLASIPIECTFAITAIKTAFTAPDITQRTLLFHLDAIPPGERDPDWYRKQLRDGREVWVAEHAHVLQRFLRLAEKEWNTPLPQQHRLAYFERGLVLMGRALGFSPTTIENIRQKLGAVADIAVAETNPFIEALLVIKAEWKGQKRTSLQAVVDFVKFDPEERFVALNQFSNSRQLGNAFRANPAQIQRSTGLTTDTRHNQTWVVFP
jgi:hypothetical protein